MIQKDRRQLHSQWPQSLCQTTTSGLCQTTTAARFKLLCRPNLCLQLQTCWLVPRDRSHCFHSKRKGVLCCDHKCQAADTETAAVAASIQAAAAVGALPAAWLDRASARLLDPIQPQALTIAPTSKRKAYQDLILINALQDTNRSTRLSQNTG